MSSPDYLVSTSGAGLWITILAIMSPKKLTDEMVPKNLRIDPIVAISESKHWGFPYRYCRSDSVGNALKQKLPQRSPFLLERTF